MFLENETGKVPYTLWGGGGGAFYFPSCHCQKLIQDPFSWCLFFYPFFSFSFVMFCFVFILFNSTTSPLQINVFAVSNRVYKNSKAVVSYFPPRAYKILFHSQNVRKHFTRRLVPPSRVRAHRIKCFRANLQLNTKSV